LEAESGIIELQGDDTTVRAVLRYLYGFDYADGVNLPQMVFNAQVCALAGKYDTLALKTLAAAKFEELAKAGLLKSYMNLLLK
jgi:hypothetical protein